MGHAHSADAFVADVTVFLEAKDVFVQELAALGGFDLSQLSFEPGNGVICLGFLGHWSLQMSARVDIYN
jgi:hypothetical protein